MIAPIILSGPSITHREIDYATDAAATGWNARATDYIHRFQMRLCALAQREFALAVSGGHPAVFLALLGLELKPGDEVIIPELADVSVASAVAHAGCTPVFCDVDPVSLCLDPGALRVTKKTRCIIPAHQYGAPCDMNALLAIAEERNLYVIEHATQGFGSVCAGRPAGSFGQISVFSFEGNGPVTAAGGAVLLTDDEAIVRRAAAFGIRQNSLEHPLAFAGLPFGNGISNIQAALGVAQLERAGELLEKKRRIHQWYKEHLADVPGVCLNPELPGRENSFWMTALLLDGAGKSRDELLNALAAERIVCAPVSPPLSSLPSFSRADNPVAYRQSAAGLVLPSGHNRTKEEIVYVAEAVKTLLAGKSLKASPPRLTGWMKSREEALGRMFRIKREGLALPVEQDGTVYHVQAVTLPMAKSTELADFMVEMLAANQHALLSNRPVTRNTALGLLSRYDSPDSDLLFFLIMEQQRIWGHLALVDFDFKKQECMLEALMMRENAPKGLAAAANLAVHAWAGETFGLQSLYNRIRAGNKRSRLLAKHLGFKDVSRTALYRSPDEQGFSYRPMYMPGRETPEEQYVLVKKDL